MINPFILTQVNNTLTCFIHPREKFPQGLNLTYDTCPENYDNQTSKIIRYCCLNIMFESIQNSFYKRTQDWLRYNSSSVLVGPAVLFNILSLIVLNRFQKNNAKTSTTFYMKCLCVFDMVTILSKFVNEYVVVRNGLRTKPILLTSWMCKFLSFSESLCAVTSIYLLIAMSVDKLLCVLIPLKVNSLLTPKRAKYIVTCIVFITGLISSYHLFDKRAFKFESEIESSETISSSSPTSTDLIPTISNNLIINETYYENDGKTTQISTTIKTISVRISYDCDSEWPNFKNDWILINNVIRVFMPILLLCLCNSWIVIGLARAKKRTNAIFRHNSMQFNENNSNRNKKAVYIKVIQPDDTNNKDDLKSGIRTKRSCSNASMYSFNQNLNKKSAQTQNNVHIRGGKNNTTQHISLMLFAVSFGFVIFNLPFAIRTLLHRQFSENFKILDYLYQEENLFTTHTSKNEIRSAIKYEFFSSLTHLLLDLNYIANFFLYFFSGSKFRAQLFSMLRCGSKPKARYEPSWVASYNMRTNGTCSNYISSANNDKSISLNNNNNNNNNNFFSNKNTNSIPNNLSVTNFK